MKLSLLALVFGFCLDLAFGDPHWMPHPVRAIGLLIEKTEHLFYREGKTTTVLIWGGACTVMLVIAISAFLPLLLLLVAQKISPFLRLALETLMCYQILATKALKTESMKVYDALQQHNLPAARKAVSMIVGRDTANLTEEQVAKATVETVAENTSDGVVAPLLFLVLGGAPLGFFYKAVNTMDSMLGYKNDRYLFFGRVAAQLDDVVNFLPARISAFFMIGAAWVLRLEYKNAVRIFWRDRFCHSSPNSAQTESVCAGALGLQLAGDACYFGKVVHKPTIGDAWHPVTPQAIPAACQLMVATAFLTLFVGVLLKSLFILW